MKKILILMALCLGLGFSYTKGYTVYPKLQCDDFLVTNINASVVSTNSGIFTASTIGTTMNYNIVTSNATLTTGNINIPVKVNGVTYYLKAHTGL